MVVAMIMCVLMAVTLVVLWDALRTFCRRAKRPNGGFGRFAQKCMWQLPAALGYGYLLDAGHRWERRDKPTVWRGVQIVLATEVGDGLVLDCLVCGATADAAAEGIGEPVTLWAHRLDSRTADPPEGGFVSAWTDAGTPVDIFCDRHGTTATLRICHGARTVSLALESAR